MRKPLPSQRQNGVKYDRGQPVRHNIEIHERVRVRPDRGLSTRHENSIGLVIKGIPKGAMNGRKLNWWFNTRYEAALLFYGTCALIRL